MATIDLPRTFDSSRLEASKAGQEIGQSGFWDFINDFIERMIRSLKNQLNFRENFDAADLDVSLPHDKDQIVATGSSKTPRHVFLTRVVGNGETTLMWTAFGWRLDKEGKLIVRVKYDNTTTAQQCRLVVCFS
jgi:hypothetical protein